MHLKSLIFGIVIGAALAIAVMFMFGDEILGDIGDATENVGRSVQKAGENLEKTGDKLR